MKAVVVYDTYYGNTKLVAEAIADELKTEGHEVELRDVKQDYPAAPQGEVMFVGSPIRMGSVTGRVKRYVKRLDKNAWKDKPIAVFTTVASAPKEPLTDKQRKSYDKWALNAGRKLRDLAKAKGLSPLDNYLWVEVRTEKGPLVETGVEKTKQFTREMLQSLKK
jgi:menaquinone-dependent protoporphyrinogen IX oxidase